ncbi:MAG: MATE family efflux transporter [Rhodothermales bacterium]|nr:MATE family efflux transporter [Rhodothermales bacterium]
MSSRFADEVRSTLVLALPVVITQISGVANGFVDTLMVGRLGPDELAGVALGNTLFFGHMILGMGIVTSVSPMVSQAFGRGDEEEIGRSVRQGLWLAFGLSIAMMVSVRNIWPLMIWMGQDPETVALSEAYVDAISWGMPGFLSFIALRGFVEALSKPLLATIIAIVGVGLNVAANYVLMYGHFGFPALGLVGTGWASTLVFWFNFLCLLIVTLLMKELARYAGFKNFHRPDLAFLRKLVKLGLPIGISQGVEVALFMGTALMMGLIGKTALAAHQIAVQCAALTFMVPLGIGIATSVRVGVASGMGDPKGVRVAGWIGVGLSCLVMLFTATFFWLFPTKIVSLFVDMESLANAPVIEIATVLMGFAAVFQLFDGIQVSAIGALRGLKDTLVPMIIAIVSYLIIGLTAGYILGIRAGYGPEGLWTGLVVGLIVASVLLIWRFEWITRAAAAEPSSSANG